MASLDTWDVLGCGRSDCSQDTDSFPFNELEPSLCDTCGRLVSVHVYPALIREYGKSDSGAAEAAASESSCFYHPQKTASVICDGCGRFLCKLCDVELNGGHSCASCIELDTSDDSKKNIAKRYAHRDSLALGLVAVGTLIWIFSCITAPIALYISIRYWNTPQSLLPRNRWRFVVAGLIASIEIVIWGLFVLGLFA